MGILSKIVGISSFACAIGVSSVAQADNTQANMNITLTISEGCSISYTNQFTTGNGSIVFTKVTTLDQTLSQSVPLYIKCSKGTPLNYTISMGKGQNFQNGTRNLASEGHLIAYKICADSECQTPWGDGTAGIGQPVTTAWDGTSDYISKDVWAVIPAQPAVALYPGTYTDTVQAQITMNSPSQ